VLKFHRGDVINVKNSFENHTRGVIFMAIPKHYAPAYHGKRPVSRKYYVKFHDGTMLAYPYQRLTLVKPKA